MLRRLIRPCFALTATLWMSGTCGAELSNDLATALANAAPHANSAVIDVAARALTCAEHANLVRNAPTLSVIDYSRPSTEPRLWVFDVGRRKLLFEELVAHGKNTGDNQAVRFSNVPGSLMSSIGVFLTVDTYVGHNGYSLRLRGLEPGFNDHALDRDIVVHGASYVRSGMAALLGRLGRSFGCPAVRPEIARTLIDTIRGGSLVVAYYPDSTWLHGSTLVGTCSAVAANNAVERPLASVEHATRPLTAAPR